MEQLIGSTILGLCLCALGAYGIVQLDNLRKENDNVRKMTINNPETAPCTKRELRNIVLITLLAWALAYVIVLFTCKNLFS